jgi:GT2 family glycosyltransferase
MNEEESGTRGYGRLARIRRVFRQEGWPGVAWRLRARLGWLGLSAPAARLPPLRRPDLVTIGAGPLEAFAAGISLPAAPEPLVSVLVPALDHVERTLRCLAAMSRHPPAASFEVVAVDDGATGDTPRLLPLVPNLVCLRSEVRQGFARSVNRAARAARGRFLLLLDDDAQVQPGWLDELVAAFEDPEVGIAGSKLVDPSGRLQEAGVVLRSDGAVEPVGRDDDPRSPEYEVIREVDHCSRASLMVPRELFLDLGGFDEAYTQADLGHRDLSLRVRSRGRKIVYVPGSVVVKSLGGTTAAPGADAREIEVDRRRLLDRWGEAIARQEGVRAIAFYLPQYHPIPENDAWWGKGFTEWSNVARARSLFPGHRQPRVPADLGFYDLRLAEVREAQAELAARHGLAGFCYYYYWFGGRRLLERPLLEVLALKRPDFPFCVCWANENWTRRWDGHDHEVLIRQQHSPEDDRLFLESLLPCFEDARYIRVKGRPLLLLYRPQLLPDVARTTATWRRVAREAGAGELYLAAVQSFDTTWDVDPRPWGFDAAVEFPPHGLAVPTAPPRGSPRGGRFFDYAKSAERFMSRPVPLYPLLRTVMPSWDNSPRRRERADIFLNGSSEAYGRWLQTIVDQTRRLRSGDERLVFINAWNEWAEGNYLEPDHDHGHAYLEATARALAASGTRTGLLESVARLSR